MRHYLLSLCTLCFLSGTTMCYGQLHIAAGTAISGTAPITANVTGNVILPATNAATNLSNLTIRLIGNNQKLTATGPTSINSLETTADGNKTIAGTWQINNGLKLSKGILQISTVPAEAGKLIYAGTAQLSGSSSSFINGPLSIKSAETGEMFYPIGRGTDYFPIGLSNVKDAGTVIAFDLNTSSLNLANIVGIKSYYQDIHWELKVESGSYSGAEAVRLGLNDKTATFYSEDGGGDAIIAEVDVNNNVLSLGGQGTSGFVVSTAEKPSAKASKYVLAKSDKISVSITRYITPNALDDKNNVLFIQNIEFFPINTVTLIDRWGVPIKTWKNFANYTSSDAVQNDFDFTKLSVGNYVCSLDYTDLDGKQQKVLQMISVVK